MNATETNGPRDAGSWATPVGKLHVGAVPAGARNAVEGKRLVGPLQGFGKMWQKTYRARFEGGGVPPGLVIAEWKEHVPRFWPEGSQFYAPLTGIKPGEIGLIRASVAGALTLSTGVLVMYSDDESFTLMTPQGHPFAGWITFSAAADAEATVVQTQVLMRAQDPLSELGLSLGGHRLEDRFWHQTLCNVAARLGVPAPVETHVTSVDRKRQWARRATSAIRPRCDRR